MTSAEALASVVLETSDEPLFVTNVDLREARIGGLGTDVARRFLEVLAENAGLVLHVRLLNGTDSAHVLEAIFKGLGAALAEACERREEQYEREARRPHRAPLRRSGGACEYGAPWNGAGALSVRTTVFSLTLFLRSVRMPGPVRRRAP